MKSPGDRLIAPLMFLSLVFLVAGLHDLARSSPGPDPAKSSGKAVQTRPAQTRPAHTRPAEHKKASLQGKGEEKPIVITDEDLKKYHTGPARPATRPAAPAPTEDPLKAFKDQQERARWREAKISELQQRIVDLEAQLKTLQQKRLSVVNPYVRRPPEGEEEKAEEKGLSGPELLARTDQEITQTKEDLESARKALAAFQENTPE